MTCGVQAEEGGAAKLRIHLQKMGGGTDEIFRFLGANHVEVSFAAQTEPNLEDVFLDLTGAGLR